MKILILGNDGYLGYPLTIHLLHRGHEVMGIDNYSRRSRVAAIGGQSLTPITSVLDRKTYLRSNFKNFTDQVNVDLGSDEPNYISSIISSFAPDTIVHLAEMPSAPWSMSDVHCASITQQENVIGTLHILWAMKEHCPDAHLVKIGTMGEYGTPDCEIPEGRIPDECIGGYPLVDTRNYPPHTTTHSCPMKGLLFPRTAGSWYHLSKVHDTHNIEFACRNWGLRSTDIMQGVVFGLDYGYGTDNEDELTRFDYDQHFGTVINRFCAQAIIDHPLTVYGSGGQIRGFLFIKDSIQCLTIAVENPPFAGEYRTFNQFYMPFQVNDLADMVCRAARKLGLHAGISHLDNPRNEAESHLYIPVHKKLFDLGYRPTEDIEQEVFNLLKTLLPYRGRVIKSIIMPTVKWT